MNQKRNRSVKRNKMLIVMSIVLFDVFLLPMLIILPAFLLNDSPGAVSSWLSYGCTGSLNDIIQKPTYTQTYLFLQVGIIALLISVMWNAKNTKGKNQIQIRDGIGGPEPSGFGQHGTARWQEKHEVDTHFDVWYTNKEIQKGGIVFGMQKKGRKEKVWLSNSDQHTLIIGATRSGKSRKIILPSIWELAKVLDAN